MSLPFLTDISTKEKSFFVFVGNCPFIRGDFYSALSAYQRWFLMNELQNHADEPGCLLPFWADLSGNNKDCMVDGKMSHPAGTHRDGDAGDLLYFTTNNSSNHTQVYNAKNSTAYPVVKLWDDNFNPTGNLAVYRSVRFLLGLERVFPNIMWCVRDFVFDHFKKELVKTAQFTAYEKDKFLMKCSVDGVDAYNHHRHIHVSFSKNTVFCDDVLWSEVNRLVWLTTNA